MLNFIETERKHEPDLETCGLKQDLWQVKSSAACGLSVITMRTGRLYAFSLQRWIEDNRHLLKPPVHEIKHDGYRVIVRRDGDRVRLYTRNGFNWRHRFPLIVQAVQRLKVRSVIIDGEAVVCGADGRSDFDKLHSQANDDQVVLCAFDLIELDGEDLRHEPLEVRNATLASVLAKASAGLRFNQHIEADGPTVFAQACRMGLEGIVSKRRDLPYRSGRSKSWLKIKNPKSPAMLRVQMGRSDVGTVGIRCALHFEANALE
jgi:bifunctional non-homologous end joining protein LigD